MIELPVCRHRSLRPEKPGGRYSCRSTRLVAPRGVSAEDCNRCKAAGICDHPPVAAPATMARPVKRVPNVALRASTRKREVPVAASTAPVIPVAKGPAPSRHDCIELGMFVNQLELEKLGLNTKKCGCLGKIRYCYEHGLCTVMDKREGMACCRTCEDYEQRPGPLNFA